MKVQLQQAMRVAKRFCKAANLIAIAYQRISQLKHMPTQPFATVSVK